MNTFTLSAETQSPVKSAEKMPFSANLCALRVSAFAPLLP
jgi:hypothetical protein